VRYPSSRRHSSRFLSNSVCSRRSWIGPSSSMTSRFPAQRKSTVYDPMGTWRRFHNTFQSHCSDGVIFFRISRAKVPLPIRCCSLSMEEPYACSINNTTYIPLSSLRNDQSSLVHRARTNGEGEGLGGEVEQKQQTEECELSASTRVLLQRYTRFLDKLTKVNIT